MPTINIATIKRITPNGLVIIRMLIALVFCLYASLSQTEPLLLVILFSIAGLSDGLDGYLARRWNVTSKLGAAIDHIADKLLVSMAIIYLCINYGSGWSFQTSLGLLLLIFRDVLIAGLREAISDDSTQLQLPVAYIGKVKTTLQLLVIAILIYIEVDYIILQLLIWLTVLISFYGAKGYISSAFNDRTT